MSELYKEAFNVRFEHNGVMYVQIKVIKTTPTGDSGTGFVLACKEEDPLPAPIYLIKRKMWE